QVIGQPERRRRVHRIRSEVRTVIGVPRAPAPGVYDRARPRIEDPYVKRRPVVAHRRINGQRDASEDNRPIDPDLRSAVVDVGPLDDRGVVDDYILLHVAVARGARDHHAPAWPYDLDAARPVRRMIHDRAVVQAYLDDLPSGVAPDHVAAAGRDHAW